MSSTPKLIYAFGPYTLDRSEWRLRRGEEVVDLPPKALAVLLLLVQRAGSLVLKDEVLAEVWKDTFVEEGNVAFYVSALRRALNDPPGVGYIETVKTRGYRFVVPVVISGADSPADSPKEESIEVVPSAPPVSNSRIRPRMVWGGVAAAILLSAALGFGWRGLFGGDQPIRSLVVVPFQSIAAGGDQAYLETGIAEAIATRLGRMTKLRIPPLAAVQKNELPFEAGRRLGTEAVLTGTVQKADDRLLVSVQLSSVRERVQLWTWSFDTKPGEILNVQDDIAERIAVRLGSDLNETDRGKLAHRDTLSGEAYDYFLQAREQLRRRTTESIKVAIGLYEKAIQLDPKFARAYAGLADCYNLTMSGLPPDYRYPRAKANAEKAVELDPGSVEGHTALAFLRYKFEWRWKDADEEFKRAIALDPRYALAHHWYGEFLRLMNRHEEGVRELKQALELDPYTLAIRNDLAVTLNQLNRTGEAREVVEAGLKIDPNWYAFYIQMSEIYAHEGRDRESAESLWRSLILRAMPTEEIDELRTAFEKGGVKEMTRAQVRQYLRQEVKPPSSASFMVATNLSLAYGRLGEKDEAFRWLETAIKRHEDAVIVLLTSPDYDSLRSDPRFDRILERLNLKPEQRAKL